MKNKKRGPLIFVLALILIPTILGLIYLSANTKKPNPTTTNPMTKKIAPTQQKAPAPTQANPQEILQERFDNRKQLSQQDVQAKQKILTLLPPGENSGTIHTSANIRIDYASSPDLFQIEVLTREIAQAKAEAVAWFMAQGMSQEGICYAPIQFYPGFELLQELKQQGIEFNPLAPGC